MRKKAITVGETHKETTVESFTALSLDCIVSGPPFRGVRPSAGFAFHLSSI